MEQASSLKTLNLKVDAHTHKKLRILCANMELSASKIITIMVQNFEGIEDKKGGCDAKNI